MSQDQPVIGHRLQVRRAAGAQTEHVDGGQGDVVTSLHVDAVDAHVAGARTAAATAAGFEVSAGMPVRSSERISGLCSENSTHSKVYENKTRSIFLHSDSIRSGILSRCVNYLLVIEKNFVNLT